MESQDKGKEYERGVREIYLKEWETASPEKKVELNKRMRRWQELMNSGLPAQQAYYKAIEGELAFGVAEEPSGKQVAIPSAPRLRKAPFIILGLALVAAIVYCVVITGDRNALNTELGSVQSVLASTQSELSSTKQTLASTQSDLALTQADLDSTEADLSSTKQSLASTQSELKSLEDTLALVQNELNTLNNTLASVQNELEATKAELRLYKETFEVALFSGKQPPYEKGGLGTSRVINLINNPIATNPTWRELKTFLLADPTDDETYWESMFNCTNFAEMLHNNAEDAGIKAAFVAVTFKDNPMGHTLNAFKTTNKGLVYVDCTGDDLSLPTTFEEWLYEQSHPIEWDKIAYVVKGKEYGLVSLDRATSPEYRFYELYEWISKVPGSGWESLGIVERIRIYW